MSNVNIFDCVYADLGYGTHIGHMGLGICRPYRKTRQVELSCVVGAICTT